MKLSIYILALLAAFTLPSQGQILSDNFSTNTLGNYNTPTGGSNRRAFTYDATNERLNGTAEASRVSSATHKTSIGTFNGFTTFNMSVDFLTTANASTQNNASVGLLGISDSATTFSNSFNGFDVTVKGVQSEVGGASGDARLRIRMNDSGTGELLSSTKFTTADSTWYTLNLSLTQNSTNNFTVSASITLQGSSTVIASIAPTAVTNNSIGGTTSLYAGFGVGLDSTLKGGAAADNFVVVPEPGAIALLGLGSLGLLAFRRRRS